MGYNPIMNDDREQRTADGEPLKDRGSAPETGNDSDDDDDLATNEES